MVELLGRIDLPFDGDDVGLLDPAWKRWYTFMAYSLLTVVGHRDLWGADLLHAVGVFGSYESSGPFRRSGWRKRAAAVISDAVAVTLRGPRGNALLTGLATAASRAARSSVRLRRL